MAVGSRSNRFGLGAVGDASAPGGARTWGVSGHDPLAGTEAATRDSPSTRATQYFDLSLEPPRQAISFDVKVERRLEI